jgi:D,D-heptose 1,7-bisphosphate phosphatase
MSEKAIFLDRDDTLIEDPGYINHPDQVRLFDGVTEALVRLKSMGYKLIVVSNQSGIARGILTEKILGQIHDRLTELLAQNGASLDRIYYCPYHPDGAVAKYRKQSDWRKPEPGMLFTAAEEMDIELSDSWMIGNSTSDIEAGIGAGCRTILIDSPSHSKRPKPGDTQPDYISVNIREAVNIIKQHQDLERKEDNTIQPEPHDQFEPSTPTVETLEEPETLIEQPIPETLEESEKQIEQSPPEPIVEEQPNHGLANEPDEPPSQSLGQNSGDNTENLLTEIIVQLKAMQRTEMFGEFSAMRLLAWILQGIVLFCLLMSIWLVLDSSRPSEAVMVPIGFAVVLQLMALTFYVIQGRK